MSTIKVYGDRPNTIPLKELATRWDDDIFGEIHLAWMTKAVN
jgi:hypothetical protein